MYYVPMTTTEQTGRKPQMRLDSMENLGMYTTIRRYTAGDGTRWIIANGRGPATAVQVDAAGCKMESTRINGEYAGQLHDLVAEMHDA